jgi:cystathionine beta-synthase
MPIYNNILETIGNTPIVRLNKVVPSGTHSFFGKVEYMNPGLSVKDRIALAIVEDGEKTGALKPGGTIIEATSGNTGLGLAMVAAVKGYKAVFVMPDKISEEKRASLRAYGAKVIITPTAVEPDDPRSFYSVAEKLVRITPNSFYTNQYHNPANPNQHYASTGPEIWEQMEGKIDVVVGGAGTGGTISGVGRYFKEKNPNIKVVVADPVGSILHDLFYYKEVRHPPQPYKVEGIGEDMLPENVHFDVIDDFVQVNDKEAFALARDISMHEGICVGPSSGSILAAAIKYSERIKSPANILAFFPDSGRSYLSKAFNEQWLRDNDLLPSPVEGKSVRDLLAARGRQVVVAAHVEDSISDVIEKLRQSGVSQLPVLSDSNLVGLVNESDLLHSLISGKVKPQDPIIHLLTGNITFIELDASIRELRSLFERGFVAICRDQEGQLQIITKIDLLTFFGEQF